MLANLLAAFAPFNIFLALVGVAAGTVIGAIPGLTATMAVAVLIPITFAMEPTAALILMGAIYTGAIYGGAYAAILLNTPGTPSAIATTFDGFPMAKRGDGDLAVTTACLASVIGGLVGALALLLLAPPLAEAALAFGPVEYFWLAIFGLSLIAALSEGDFLKGMIGACVGLLLAMVGISETSAEVRYTLGSTALLGGIEVVSALIGLYCIPVLMDLVAVPDRHLEPASRTRGFRLVEATALLIKNGFNTLRSAVIGTLVGALPGAGGSIAGLVAYSEARRAARRPQDYGKGEPGGVIATEAANNATVGGGFIPTLVLGIPGTPPDAVILGALLVQGVRTGPALFSEGATVVYTFIFGLLLATLLMLPVGLLIGRFAYGAIVTAPKALLVPVVAFMTLIGAYSIRNSLSDVIIMIALGVVGWGASQRGFSVSPVVLGLILGRIAEQGFVQSWTIGSAIGDLWGQFFGRPLSLAIIGLTLLTVLYPLWPGLRRRWTPAKSQATQGQSPAKPQTSSRASPPALGLEAAGFALTAALAGWALWEGWGLNPEAAVFPLTIATAMALLSLAGLGRLALTRRAPAVAVPGSAWRRGALPLVMLAATTLIPTLGFDGAGLLVGLALMAVAQHQPLGVRGGLAIATGIVGVILLVSYGFRHLLGVPLPSTLF
ncbi:MAG: tripartite tricarboxylate transporter permease [Candidatus Competibacterales bacterium]